MIQLHNQSNNQCVVDGGGLVFVIGEGKHEQVILYSFNIE